MQATANTAAKIISTTAYVAGYGSDKNARRVHGLTKAERQAIREKTAEVVIEGCHAYKGITTRRVIEVKGRFFARMPITA